MKRNLAATVLRMIRMIAPGRIGGRLVGAALLLLGGCSASPAPLTIEMYNADTRQTMTCRARDQLGWADRSLLAATVETCARQLEERGFVRR